MAGIRSFVIVNGANFWLASLHAGDKMEIFLLSTVGGDYQIFSRVHIILVYFSFLRNCH